MSYSECCNAPIIMGDICSDCGEHCDEQTPEDEFFEEGYFENN